MENLRINIGLFGCSNVGKSTFLDAIMGKQYSYKNGIKTPTLIPRVYSFSKDSTNLVNEFMVRELNGEVNFNTACLINSNRFDLDKCRVCHSGTSSYIDPPHLK
jgi:GTPase SAR1 family protein